MKELTLVLIVVASSHVITETMRWCERILRPGRTWHAEAVAFDRAVMEEYRTATAGSVFTIQDHEPQR